MLLCACVMACWCLRVGKTLESELATDASKQFTFVVELLNDAGQPDASINKTISGVVFTNGVSGPIRLRGGMYKLLQDLPLLQVLLQPSPQAVRLLLLRLPPALLLSAA